MKMEDQPNKEKCEGNKYCEQLVARIKELTKENKELWRASCDKDAKIEELDWNLWYCRWEDDKNQFF